MPSGRLIVTVRFSLTADGALVAPPRVVAPTNWSDDPELTNAVEAALQAVRTCAPFEFATDPAFAQHYSLWRDIEFTFRPSR